MLACFLVYLFGFSYLNIYSKVSKMPKICEIGKNYAIIIIYKNTRMKLNFSGYWVHVYLGFLVCSFGYMFAVYINSRLITKFAKQLNYVDERMNAVTKFNANHVDMNNRFQFMFIAVGLIIFLFATVVDILIIDR